MANKEEGSLRNVIAVSLTNLLDSGGIVTVSVGLATTAWPMYLGFADNGFLISLIGAITGGALGGALGALIGGFITDHFGRTPIYKYNLLVYALGALLIMVSTSMPVLFAGIIIMGLSTGAGIPASWSYISEVSSNTKRAYNIGMSQLAWSVGPALIYIVSSLLDLVFPMADASGNILTGAVYGPFDGLLAIRIMFAGLLVISLVAWSMQRTLKESEDWSEKRAATKLTTGQILKRALSNAINVKTMAFLVVFYLSWNLVAGGMGMFMPYMYTAAGGFTAFEATMLSAVVWVLCCLSSYFIFARLADKVSHRLICFIGSAMALASWVLMTFFGVTLQNGTSEQVVGWVLPAFVILWGVSSALPQAFYALWSTELFPAQYRGGVSGVMFFLVRVITALWFLVMGGVINVGTPQGFTNAGIVMCGFLLISLLVGTIGTPNTRGRELDDIVRERYGDEMM